MAESTSSFVSKVPFDKLTLKEQLTRVVLGEASIEGLKGQQAVLNVISNRNKNKKHKTYKETINDGFSVLNNKDSNEYKSMMSIPKDHKTYKQVEGMVSILLDPKQKLKDITNGADHYFNPKLYKEENKDKKPPKWTRELTKSAWIGNHTFYNSKWSKPHERGFLDSLSYKEKPPSLAPVVEKTPPVLEIQIEEVPPPSIPKKEKEVVNLEAVRTEQFRKFFPEIYSKKFREDYGSLVRQETLSILAKEALTENPDNPKNARKYFLNKLIDNPEDFVDTSMTGEPIDYSREEKKKEGGFVSA